MRLPALLTAVALAASLAAAPAMAAEPTSGTLRTRVAALQAEVEAAGTALSEGARAYEQAGHRLAVLTQQQFAVQGDLERQDDVTARSRTGVSALVRAAYKGQGLPPALSAILSGDPRALSDLARVRATVDRVDTARRSDLRDLVAARGRTESLLAQRAVLRREALAQQQALDAKQQEVADEAARLSARLTAAAAALDGALQREAEAARAEAARRAAEAAQAAAARAAAQAAAAAVAAGRTPVAGVPVSYAPGAVDTSGGSCAPAAPHGYANGFLPDAVLCSLPGRPGQRLRTDAAQSFVALDAARTAAGLPPLCVTDSYRDYVGQVDVFRRKPQLAAVPGRSQHGWGLALDLGCGAERFEGEPHLWLVANAGRFGWVHPSWAQRGGSRPEPWHWEFLGG